MAERRPALDVRIPPDASPLVDLIDAIVDECRPYAIEELNTAPGDDTGPHDRVRRVHFFSNDDRATAAVAIAEHFGDTGIIATAVAVADDGAAWAARSQANVRAIRVDRVVVAPPWDLPPDTADIIPVIVHPSMGFGTGHNSTTRLCLRALQTQPIRGRHVTDVGTGSGVLAITAAKLGTASVVAIENDEDAALGCAAQHRRQRRRRSRDPRWWRHSHARRPAGIVRSRQSDGCTARDRRSGTCAMRQTRRNIDTERTDHRGRKESCSRVRTDRMHRCATLRGGLDGIGREDDGPRGLTFFNVVTQRHDVTRPRAFLTFS